MAGANKMSGFKREVEVTNVCGMLVRGNKTAGFERSVVNHDNVELLVCQAEALNALGVKTDLTTLTGQNKMRLDFTNKLREFAKLPPVYSLSHDGKFERNAPAVAKADLSIDAQLNELISVGKLANFDALRTKLNAMVTSGALPLDVATTIKAWIGDSKNVAKLNFGAKDFF